MLTVIMNKDYAISYHEPMLRNEGSWTNAYAMWCGMVMLC
jgi:hypothetical protein